MPTATNSQSAPGAHRERRSAGRLVGKLPRCLGRSLNHRQRTETRTHADTDYSGEGLLGGGLPNSPVPLGFRSARPLDRSWRPTAPKTAISNRIIDKTPGKSCARSEIACELSAPAKRRWLSAPSLAHRLQWRRYYWVPLGSAPAATI